MSHTLNVASTFVEYLPVGSTLAIANLPTRSKALTPRTVHHEIHFQNAKEVHKVVVIRGPCSSYAPGLLIGVHPVIILADNGTTLHVRTYIYLPTTYLLT